MFNRFILMSVLCLHQSAWLDQVKLTSLFASRECVACLFENCLFFRNLYMSTWTINLLSCCLCACNIDVIM